MLFMSQVAGVLLENPLQELDLRPCQDKHRGVSLSQSYGVLGVAVAPVECGHVLLDARDAACG